MRLLLLHPVENVSWEDCPRVLDDGCTVHARVGSYRPNPFGLCDVSGNVGEWCLDIFQGSHAGAPTDGSARIIEHSPYRVYRDGGWLGLARFCRSTTRYGGLKGNRNENRGLRPALSLPSPCFSPRAAVCLSTR